MPSEYVRDPDREFFEICRKAYPYILYGEPEFVEKLINQIKAIDHSHNDMNKANLYDVIEVAETMIDEWDAKHTGTTKETIKRHLFRVTSFEDRFAALEELAKGKRGRKADKELSELKEKVEQLSKEIENIKHGAVEIKSKEVEIKPSAIEIKPDTGKIELPKKKLTGIETEQKLELLRNNLKINKEITNAQCREICGVDFNQAGHLLRKLVKENFIEQKGKWKATKYIIRE